MRAYSAVYGKVQYIRAGQSRVRSTAKAAHPVAARAASSLSWGIGLLLMVRAPSGYRAGC